MNDAIRINRVIATGGGPIDDQIVYMVDSDNVFRFHTPGRVHTYCRIEGRDIIFYQGVEAWQDSSEQFHTISSSIFPTITASSYTNQRPMISSPRSLLAKSLYALRSLMG